MHLYFKPVFFQDLQEAFFIMYAGNVERVNKFMDQNSRSWSIAMTFNFAYISLRMKIMVPPPHMLYCRLKDVFDFFEIRKI